MSIELIRVEQQVLGEIESKRAIKLITVLKRMFGIDQALTSLPNSAEVDEYCQKIIAGLDLNIEANDLPDCLKPGNKKGVLIYGPHAFILGPLILFLLLKMARKFHVVGGDLILKYLPELEDTIIPISLSKRGTDAQTSSRIGSKLQARLKLLFLDNHEDRTVDQIKQDNDQTLRKVAGLLDSGQVVILFPTPSPTDNINQVKDWKPGIGRVLNYVTRPDEVLLQSYTMTEVNFKRLFLSFIWKYRFGGHPATKTIKFRWSKAKQFGQVLDTNAQNPELIARRLAEDYIQELSKINLT